MDRQLLKQTPTALSNARKADMARVSKYAELAFEAVRSSKGNAGITALRGDCRS